MIPRIVKDLVARVREGRSPKWPSVRRAHLLMEPTCAVCGGKKALNVHHRKPFHLFPRLELEHSNLITLCEDSKIAGTNCHFLFGHLGDWKAWNPTVIEDAEAMRLQILNRKYTR